MFTESTDLELRIVERKAWLREIIRFVMSLRNKSKLIKTETHDCHTTEVRTIEEVGGLSFRHSTGLSMMGNASLEVFQGPLINDSKALVFHYNGSDWWMSITQISKDGDWESKLAHAIENQYRHDMSPQQAAKELQLEV